MAVLCALGNYLLVRRAILLIAEREQVHNERKLDSLSELNDLLEAESDDAMGQLMHISGDNIRLMSSVLARYVEEDRYTGPRTYEDGFVFELKDGEVIYPDALPMDLRVLARIRYRRHCPTRITSEASSQSRVVRDFPGRIHRIG